MSHTNKFNGNWSITGSADSAIDVTAKIITINGNLVVAGSTTTIKSLNSVVQDNVITLNSGEPGAGVSQIYAGMEVDRGSLGRVTVRWNELITEWELSNDGLTYSPISTTATFRVINDPAPQLGGNLDTLGSTIFNSSGDRIKLNSSLSMRNASTVPAAQAGYNTVYSQTPLSGGSGLFVNNSTAPAQELVTKRKAIVFALIM
jgi:hypothetical protein